MTYFLGLLLLAMAFGIKRWRYLRSRRADEEYEKRRWGQARVVSDVRFSTTPHVVVYACMHEGGPAGLKAGVWAHEVTGTNDAEWDAAWR